MKARIFSMMPLFVALALFVVTPANAIHLDCILV